MPNSNFQKLLKKEMTRKDFLSFTAIALISLIGVAGVLSELISHAETPYASSDAAAGKLTGTAKVVANSGAATGSAVEFEAATSSGGSTLELGVMVGTGGLSTANTAAVNAFETLTGAKITYVTDVLPWNAGYSGSGWGWDYLNTQLSGWFAAYANMPYQLVLDIPMICQDESGDNQNSLADGASSFTSTLSVGGGTLEGYFTSIATQLVACGYDNAYIRPGWEFDGNWYPWYVGSSADAANYTAFFINIVNAMRAVKGTNFKFIWGPAGFGTSTDAILTASYPGNDYVDLITLDCYDTNFSDEGAFPGGVTNNTCTVAQSNTIFSSMETIANGLNWLVTFANSKGKPFGLAECACTYSTNPSDDWYNHTMGDDPTFVENVYNWAASSGASYINWWQSPGDDGSASYVFTSGELPNTLAAYKRLFG
jgi:hypothetical protein